MAEATDVSISLQDGKRYWSTTDSSICTALTGQSASCALLDLRRMQRAAVFTFALTTLQVQRKRPCYLRVWLRNVVKMTSQQPVAFQPITVTISKDERELMDVV